ncbi:Protein of unknown function DUF1997 [Dillenia turbinata]|uniref:Uncharacterized protein n=1 Tax=Dillenia turbinata TaxID=194707 RepID=A0AAN8VT30_9MAGN
MEMALGSSSPSSPLTTSLFSKTTPPKSTLLSLRISCSASNPNPKARFIARRRESVSVKQLQRPLIEYMSLPASQYSVLDAERIERVDDNTFRCYVYRFKFFNFEVCPVLLVKVEEQPNGCCIKLLSCKLEGSPIVVAQNEKFDGTVCYLARLLYILSVVIEEKVKRGLNPRPVKNQSAASMVNRISCDTRQSNSSIQQLTSDAVIEVSIDIPLAFRPIPVGVIESTGAQVLDQILRLMLPRFMAQVSKNCDEDIGHMQSYLVHGGGLQFIRRHFLLVKDYQVWASGDTTRQPVGTGQI